MNPVWKVARTSTAWKEIGWDNGPLRIKGGRAIYQAVMHNCATARSDNVKLARLGEYHGATCQGLREVCQYVGPDVVLEFLQPTSAALSAGAQRT